jgi:hypothetical protein
VTKLVYSRMNAAWLFMFGGQPLHMSGAPLFYASRADAVREATSRGLRVTLDLAVSVDPTKCAHPPDARTDRTCAACGVSLSNDGAGETEF